MSTIDTVDRIDIRAPKQHVYDVVSNYPAITSWFPIYHCRLLDGTEVREGSRVEHIVGKPPYAVLNRFIRTVQRMVPGERLEETYDEGDLVGNGTWTFDERNGITTTAYHCAVRGNTLFLRMTFKLTGSLGHNLVYGRLLGALKKHCERAAPVDEVI
ncbi:MAG: hypothetical protein JRS35_14595 [Deltaproteobacteria bacterium]|nr:hypothetical protein [Deltaproteobacteria bacterium]